ncbi:probable E3 ubiquitin-protein ligase DTX3 [Hippoglossus hippoglossus]|uniref:probable E3 ubiquitin-protein ligase DTX3 isoform X2 n=1 Tax=Hippoglossus stenolepis TaxID=195615 RepID=UPI00148E32EA|nr:probable E3 ubiquitin-protein ligase DTX3 [Hippoglossus hippoglossus]XP_035016387.1 probable E3 ubiquitin-protein ligase DTX3 isoform X2 [Hippoglossus stenolepis]
MRTRKQLAVLVASQPEEKKMENTRNKKKKSSEDCAICLDQIQEEKTLACRHSFCAHCIDQVFRVKPACPICNTYHGAYTGTQPRGTMAVTRSWQRLPGYEHCGCIIIQYSFPGGIQGPEHPNPGVHYSGTDRTAYLPACKEGEKVARLLKKAFDRRLIFTIGQSATTGLNNVITWNDVHHKTSTTGGPQCFGYPDPAYLFRVQEELRLQGVTEDN